MLLSRWHNILLDISIGTKFNHRCYPKIERDREREGTAAREREEGAASGGERRWGWDGKVEWAH